MPIVFTPWLRVGSYGLAHPEDSFGKPVAEIHKFRANRWSTFSVIQPSSQRLACSRTCFGFSRLTCHRKRRAKPEAGIHVDRSTIQASGIREPMAKRAILNHRWAQSRMWLSAETTTWSVCRERGPGNVSARLSSSTRAQ